MILNHAISQHLAPRKAAWILARGRVGIQKCIRANKTTDAFGNVVGSALGSAIGEALKPSAGVFAGAKLPNFGQSSDSSNSSLFAGARLNSYNDDSADSGGDSDASANFALPALRNDYTNEELKAAGIKPSSGLRFIIKPEPLDGYSAEGRNNTQLTIEQKQALAYGFGPLNASRAKLLSANLGGFFELADAFGDGAATSADGIQPQSSAGPSKYSLSRVNNLYEPIEGHFTTKYNYAANELSKSQLFSVDAAVYSVAQVGLLIPTLVESVATGVYNAPNQIYRAGHEFYNVSQATTGEDSIENLLAGVRDLSFGALGIAGGYGVLKGGFANISSANALATRNRFTYGTYDLAKSPVGAVDSDLESYALNLTKDVGSNVVNSRPNSLDLSSKFTVSKNSNGAKFQYGDPQGFELPNGDYQSHGIVGFVDKNGILGFDVFADPALRTTHGSGSDLFNSLLKRVSLENVNINGIRGAWIKGTDSVNYAQYRAGIVNGLTPEKAALNTWTGKIVQANGYTRVEQVIDQTNVYVTFKKPQ